MAESDSPSAVVFSLHQDRRRRLSTVIVVGGSLLRAHLAGVHIWFVTSRAGGPIHIKLMGRNPLGGNVGTDEHGAPRSPVFTV